MIIRKCARRVVVVPVLILLACIIISSPPVSAEVVTRLALPGRIVALTFDACETKTPSYFDESILSYVLKEKIPFTIFVGGKFARRNKVRLAELAGYDFVEIENHSMNHELHMERLNNTEIVREVKDNEGLIQDIIKRTPHFFRFPGGNCDARSLRVVEGLGYEVVHWSFAAGDDNRDLTPEQLTSWVLSKTKPGSILIFHINGRGYATGRALPGIVDALRKKHFTFVNLTHALAK